MPAAITCWGSAGYSNLGALVATARWRGDLGALRGTLPFAALALIRCRLRRIPQIFEGASAAFVSFAVTACTIPKR